MNKPLTQNEMTATRALAGRVSLITGSTSGIGLGIARALAAAGSAVVLNGFGKPEEITATQGKLAEEFGVTVQYSAADMSSPASVAEMMEATLASLGRLDVLVNNASSHRCRTFRPPSGTRSSQSTCRRRSTPRASLCPAWSRTNGAASSTLLPLTGSWPRRSNRLMWPPSMASSASPR